MQSAKRRSRQPKPYDLDDLDLQILEKLLGDARATFKELAVSARSDQRTIASHFERMVKAGIIKRVTIEVDWSKVGLTTSAFVGSTTALGAEDVKKLFDFMRREPRVLEAYTTLGTHEYFMKVLDFDIATLRSGISAQLEPLTADLSTSVIVSPIKEPDFAGLLRYLKKVSRD
jgi:DNA-binding Lrp family transcriptional regulator